ncbi:MAG: TIGR03643 family protein [Flavobacteriales bacterium]
MNKLKLLNLIQIDRIIEMAWEDRTPFEAIQYQFGLSESDVIRLMRLSLKESSFKLWRQRVQSGVSNKHLKKRSKDIKRFKCSRQKSISNNKISKR